MNHKQKFTTVAISHNHRQQAKMLATAKNLSIKEFIESLIDMAQEIKDGKRKTFALKPKSPQVPANADE